VSRDRESDVPLGRPDDDLATDGGEVLASRVVHGSGVKLLPRRRWLLVASLPIRVMLVVAATARLRPLQSSRVRAHLDEDRHRRLNLPPALLSTSNGGRPIPVLCVVDPARRVNAV
jgi:hypothetical protein